MHIFLITLALASTPPETPAKEPLPPPDPVMSAAAGAVGLGVGTVLPIAGGAGACAVAAPLIGGGFTAIPFLAMGGAVCGAGCAGVIAPAAATGATAYYAAQKGRPVLPVILGGTPGVLLGLGGATAATMGLVGLGGHIGGISYFGLDANAEMALVVGGAAAMVIAGPASIVGATIADALVVE